jgi:hypothetical protein
MCACSRIKLLVLFLSVCVLLGIIGGSIAVIRRVPLLDTLSQQQLWELHKPQRYVIDLTWSSVWRHGRARIEVRGDRFIRGTDPTNNQPLPPATLWELQAVGSIEVLFAAISSAERRVIPWHLRRAVPPLVAWLDACAESGPHVRYDPTFGYPSHVAWSRGPCDPKWQTDVQIRNLQPLP